MPPKAGSSITRRAGNRIGRDVTRQHPVSGVNTPPVEAGGFGLRLKAVSIGHPADEPPPPQGAGWFDQQDTSQDYAD